MTHEPFPVLCDLDGVVWLAHHPIAGSVEAIASLETHGHRVVFVTNNSFSTLAEHHGALARLGIAAEGNVITSSMAAATLVEPGERVMVVGGAGIVEALSSRGCQVLSDADDPTRVDAVMVGLHRGLTYDGLARATQALHRGARLIGTNDDATFPTPDGPVPGGGAMLAALQTASGQAGVIAGKPHHPMATAVRNLLGVATGTMPEWWHDVVMVGDRPSTDGAFARLLGCRFALVRSGVTAPGEDPEMSVDLDVADLAAVAAAIT
jgi:4-nitrophenyl phosphatase